MNKELAKELAEKHLSVAGSDVSTLVGGQVGNVFRVRTAERDYVVKFVTAKEEFPFDTEEVNDRVYGSRWSNLLPTYELLKTHAVATPNIYASGTLEDEKVHFAIFDYLVGDNPDHSPEWFAVLGRHMGIIHSITRPFQGWVSMGYPYKTSWNEAFQESIQSQYQTSKGFLDTNLAEAVSAYIAEYAPKLQSPVQFVLSHTDGIQAVLKKKDSDWQFQGVIDVEDYQFTDQRFVLSGVELTHAMQGHKLPEAFWVAYRKAAQIDETYSQFKTLFQIFYLLVWVRVLQGNDDAVRQITSHLNQLLTR